MSLPTELLSSRYKGENTSTREDLEINDYISNKEFEEALTSQYLGYMDIGRNLLTEYDLEDIGLDLDILRNFITHVNESILSVPEYSGSHTEYQIKFMFRVIYEFLFVDLRNRLNIGEVRVSDDATELKKSALGHYSELYDILKSSNPESFITLKYGYIISLLDNDLEGLIPHINKIKDF